MGAFRNNGESKGQENGTWDLDFTMRSTLKAHPDDRGECVQLYVASWYSH